VLELLWLVLTTVLAWVRPRHDLMLENLLLRHQLAVLTRPTRTRPRARLRVWDKLLWVLARRFRGGWREHQTFVTSDSVVRWHRQGWRLFWRWRYRSPGGRPHLSPELQDLILTMSRENRLWGTERIRGELLKLGIKRAKGVAMPCHLVASFVQTDSHAATHRGEDVDQRSRRSRSRESGSAGDNRVWMSGQLPIAYRRRGGHSGVHG
jgi:hypothetical protein